MAAVPSTEAYLLHLLRRAERHQEGARRRGPAVAELRALEFWRAIIGECLATALYVFLVCGAHVAWPLHSVNTLTKSFATGFAAATAAHCFGHVSGAHANPALTLSMLVARRISPLRAALYATAQCGGAIAGAALIYGLSASPDGGYREKGLGCTMVEDSLPPWRAAGMEAALTFIVALTLFASADPDRKNLGSDALAMGISYLVCSLIALPATGASMNPARSLGPAFVTNTWANHWVYWCGPVTGAVLAGLIYEYIFESPRKVPAKEDSEESTNDVREENSNKPPVVLTPKPAKVHQGTFLRTAEGSRPPSRGSHAQYSQQVQPYYSSLPRGGGHTVAYRTWDGSEYGSGTQFKF